MDLMFPEKCLQKGQIIMNMIPEMIQRNLWDFSQFMFQKFAYFELNSITYSSTVHHSDITKISNSQIINETNSKHLSTE